MTGLVPLMMSGHDRTYMPPRAVRRSVTSDDPLAERIKTGGVTAWDLFELEHREETASWATATLTSLVAAAETEAAEALGCTECEDTGFYGISDRTDPDLLVGLVRRTGDEAYEALAADGGWSSWTDGDPIEVLDLDTAGDLGAAIIAGASGLLRRFCQPLLFLPPEPVVSALSMHDVLLSADDAATPRGEWVNYAVVDAQDPGAVYDLVRIQKGEDDLLERWEGVSWTPDAALLSDAGLPLSRLRADQVFRVQEAVTHSASALADPLTAAHVPDPRGEKLRQYWEHGKGALKIRWGTPGDWKRCFRHLSKYLGPRAKGYCQLRHKDTTGVYTGSRLNPGHRSHRGGLLSSIDTPETALLASLRDGSWRKGPERTSTMPELTLADGVYTEADAENDGLLRTLTAGGFPVAPPDEWFADPKFPRYTPLEVDDDGRVYGHIAPWNATHIGMAGRVKPPHSQANYAYFRTGALRTASGKTVNVGQITLTGGHASINATAAEAVKHYDDTASAVADLAAGEDAHGIWVAGGLRSNITPEQIRAFRASAVSGDWRPIGGGLELVAVCSVNTPGFMSPRAEAMVAGGVITALVAAGVTETQAIRASQVADAALESRLQAIEAKLVPAVQGETTELEEVVAASTTAPEAEEIVEAEIVEDPALDARRTAARAAISATKRQLLRDRVSGLEAACKPKKKKGMAAAAPPKGKVPPQFAKTVKTGSDGAKKTANGPVTLPDGSFPISDVASLKDAIQANGRSKNPEAAKRHIISMCMKLGHPELIPDNWRSKSNA